MPFEFSCFISYRHCQQPLGKKIVTTVYNALSSELELMTEKRVFLDTERLEGGYFWNEALAEAICRSVCMLVLFTPDYFNLQHIYPTREYLGMEALEAERLLLLKSIPKPSAGLIIPVIVRGPGYLPAEISNKRQYYDFSAFQLFDKEMAKHRKFAPMIKSISEFIAWWCHAFEKAGVDPCGACKEFSLPNEDRVVPWLEAVKSRAVPFPGRGDL